MFKSRYYYYLIFLNMLANIVVFVPRILLDDRRNGALSAMLIAIPLGLMISYFFTKFMSKFPGKGLPEVLKEVGFPKFLTVPLIGLTALLWFSAGILALLAFTDITKRFINPDIGVLYIALLFLLLVVWASKLPTEKVLYLLEIVLIVNVPVIAFLFLKAIMNDALSWPDMTEASTYIMNIPSFDSLAATTYIFTGYINIVIFNRVFNEKINMRPFIFVIFIGIGVVLTTFFIPIGYFGFDGVGEFNFPWITATDAIRIEFGFVERVFFVFLLLYIGVALINVIVHWHVGLELILSILPEQKKKKKFKWLTKDLIVLLIIASIYMFIQFYMDETTVFKLGEWWLRLRMPNEYILVLAIILYVWRKRR
ncbi:hypothetical protein SM124_01840 [Bacillus sp. 31A1R]|uniref:Spore germination protein n=1 Tax=Robertmurraya mangrovi TaxID=3098077 RepID=A0ABU5ITJ2_9BACI|nr:hypothetical protein [Bacillus sp. 31A1R]MDZ5470480.1 hypothetical protein [Bacillus sp. 31A1R]